VGHEEARPGATLENGWALQNIAPCNFLDFYQSAGYILGAPVSGFDGTRQSFEFGQLVCLPNNPPGQQVVLANLGYLDLRSTGQIPQPGAPLSPATQDFLILSLERGGIDTAVFFGAPISPALCDNAGHCVQYTEKARLEFPQGATSGEQVTRSPLGLWQSHPETRPGYLRAKLQAATRTAVRLPLLISGLVCLALGLVLLLSRVFGHGFRASATI